MGLKPNFSKQDIKKFFEDRVNRIDKAIINRLKFVGETFVKNARENGNYLDQTGNLRSSIGYVVLKDGKTIVKNFQQSAKGTDKSKGINEAKNLIKEVKADLSNGYVLIVVAGMQYAAAVESRGRDVLTASSITAKNDLEKALEALKNKIGKL